MTDKLRQWALEKSTKGHGECSPEQAEFWLREFVKEIEINARSFCESKSPPCPDCIAISLEVRKKDFGIEKGDP
jgi:hypothetical protein